MPSGSRALSSDVTSDQDALRIEYVDAESGRAAAHGVSLGRHVLAEVHYDRSAEPSRPRVPGAPLRVDVPLEQLGSQRSVELWTIADEPEIVSAGPVTLACGARATFGSLVFSESAEEDDHTRFEASVSAGYRALFAALDEYDLHAIRIWCTIPRIHELDHGLERYQSFCRARARVLDEHIGAGFEATLCASTAVGSNATFAQMHVLATPSAGTHHENPRQLSAYAYPDRYGPRSPSFARATLAPSTAGAGLYVSGTASIVGSESLHVGDLGAQLDATLENLRVVTANGAPEPALRLAPLKVYVRRAETVDDVARVLADDWKLASEVMFLRADICREELLVEIEGIGLAARARANRA